VAESVAAKPVCGPDEAEGIYTCIADGDVAVEVVVRQGEVECAADDRWCTSGRKQPAGSFRATACVCRETRGVAYAPNNLSSE